MGDEDFFDELNSLLLDDAEETEQKVADIENAEGPVDEEPEPTPEANQDEQANGEENLEIRYKKSKQKEEKLEATIAELEAKLAEKPSKEEDEEFMTDDEKAESLRDKEIESLKKQVDSLKFAKQKEINKLAEDKFFEDHPELATDKKVNKKKMETYLTSHEGVAKEFVKGELGYEDIYVLMGGKPKQATADPTKVFGSASSEPSNPRMAPEEPSVFEKAVDVLDKGFDSVPAEEFEQAQNDAIRGVADLFFAS